MLCMDVMRRDVLRIAPTDTVEAAARRMRDANVGLLPVCDRAGKVLGTITDRDITIRATAEGRLPAACAIEDVMTPEVVSCRGTDELSRVEELMGRRKKSRILVTTEDGRLEGIVSLSDVAQYEGARQTGATVRELTTREAHW
jgi:CBS domain-containing protein